MAYCKLLPIVNKKARFLVANQVKCGSAYGHNRACEEIEQMILESSAIPSEYIWFDCRNTATYYRKPMTVRVLRRINRKRRSIDKERAINN